MSEKIVKNIPKLRFSAFKDDGEWEIETLNKLTDILRCGIAATPKYVDDGVVFLSSQNVTNEGKLNLDKFNYISREHYEKISKNAKLKKSDILYTRVGAGYGNATVFPLDGDYGVYVSLTHIRVNKKLNNHFLSFSLNAPVCKIQAENGVFQGGGVPNLNVKVVEKFHISYPSIEEQKKIADCLSSIDSLIAAQYQKVKLLKEHKKGLLQNLLPQDGASVPIIRFPEFENDGEWEEKEVGDIANSKSSSLALNKLTLQETGYPVYGADSIVGYIDEFQQDEQYISIVKDGSGVGRLNLCKSHSSILGTLTCLKSKNKNKYNLKWIFYMLNTIDFSVYIKGAGIPHIYYSDFKYHTIMVPELQEQQKIADCLSSVDEQINFQTKKVEELKEHKKALLQQLFPSNEVA